MLVFVFLKPETLYLEVRVQEILSQISKLEDASNQDPEGLKANARQDSMR